MEGLIIVDPPIPYVGRIRAGRFSPARMIKIQGITPSLAYSFNISLQCGPEMVPRSDIGMQVTVGMVAGCISLNSLQNGIWGEEQRCFTLPIKRCKKFEIILKCHPNKYELIINSQHFCDFPHRIHYDRIIYLVIDGDVSITQISYMSATMNEGEPSTNGVHWTAASAPSLQIQNEIDGFEPVDSNSALAPPPSYEAAVEINQIGFLTADTPTTGPSCPTSMPRPTSAPYPIESETMPMPSVTPFSTSGRAQTPTVPPRTTSRDVYPPSAAPLIPPPPPGAPRPLNAGCVNPRPVLSGGISPAKQCAAFGLGIFIGLVLIGVIMLIIFKVVVKH